MPNYDIVCHPCKALWDNVYASFSQRAELGGVPCPNCGGACESSWHNRRAPGVLVARVPFQVAGLKGEFSTFGEVEKAADAQGQRILEGAEKEAVRESNREASAAYAEQLGYGSKEEFGEARKKDGEGMVQEARQRYVEQQRRRYGAGYDLSASDDKWGEAGLSQQQSE